MTIEEIRKNAPKLATHYNPEGVKAVYYYHDGKMVRVYNQKHDRWYGSMLDSLSLLQPLY